MQKIRGPGGTRVRLQVLPAGAAPGSPEKTIELMRDKVKLEEQQAKKELLEIPFNGKNYRIGVITVPSFYQDFAARSRGDDDYTSTSRDVTRLIEEFKAEGGMDGLVMDLRANGGGHLSEATELSGLFIERGPIVQLRETRGTIQAAPRSEPDGHLRRSAGRPRRSLQRQRVGDLRRSDPGLRPRRHRRPANVRQRLRAESLPARPPHARHR